MSASKKQRVTPKRPPTGRPPATTTISQPIVEDTAKQSIICSFSPDGDLFAFLMLAVDKHRLRVYDTCTNQSAAEYIFESARATSLTWGEIDLSMTEDVDYQPSTKKRRKKEDTNATKKSTDNKLSRVIILGSSDGAILLFSPSHGRVIRKLIHPSSSAAVLSVAVHRTDTQTIWASGADSAVRIWDIKSGNILSHWKNEERVPYTCVSLLPVALDSEDQHFLLAHHSIQFSSITGDSGTSKPERLASFTGHASQIKNLEWDTSRSPPERFYSSAEGDRFLYMWEIPKEGSKEGKPLLSIPLESAIDTFTQLEFKLGVGGTILVTLSVSGKVSFFHISEGISTPANSDGPLGQKVPTMVPRSQISKTGEPMAKIVGISPIPGQQGYIRVSRLINGIRPVFHDVRYLDDAGDFVQNIVLEDVDNNIISGDSLPKTTYNKRYAEGGGLSVGSGAELALMNRSEDGTLIDGDLNVDIAELSLGQRLTVNTGEDKMFSGSDRSEKNDSDGGRKSRKSEKAKSDVVPANSLTRTLIQALHSSDSGLLEICLAHSDPAVISNTVKRLPVQLAVPLITACTERLGRGARSANLKGRGGGASSQRGNTLVVWIRTVLATHGGYLMTIPDLVAKLSGLHATLTTRLTLQQSLLSLSGRLELMLSQMQIRSSVAPAPLVSRDEKSSKGKAKVTKYIEGESEGEESEDGREDELMDIEEIDDDNGSVEDVELGASSEEASSEESDEVNDSEDEGDMDVPTVNGFIDDEAEEYSEEEDSNSE